MADEDKKLLGLITVTQDIADDIAKNISHIVDFGKKIEEYTRKNTTILLDAILYSAIHLDASDVHIEPQDSDVRLRIRIDGVLQDAALLSREIYESLLSRVKLLSKLKLNITEKPQDGRFSVAIPGNVIEVRTSSLPSQFGESIVLRVLNPKNLMKLEELGLRKDLYMILEKEIKRPNGMIAVVGPTGSGKTTTLYAFLTKIQNPEIKVITIEDPIEYHIQGVSQTQVAPEKGYRFSEGLMSIVRQDPDVILVGEIRDGQTAKIAVQAALTGHLVLTTIHTNDAAGAIPRLVDLGAQPSSVGPALKMVVGERLVRKVCKDCRKVSKPTKEELDEIKKGLKGIPKNIELPKKWGEVRVARVSEKGCNECNFTGYKGRKGLFEIFLVDAHMEKFILSNPPVSSIKEELIKRGMVTMYQSGLIDVIFQETTLDEVKRVVETD